MQCIGCLGHAEYIGTLGNRDVYRCRHCGLTFTVEGDE